jgi:hypothetical protein
MFLKVSGIHGRVAFLKTLREGIHQEFLKNRKAITSPKVFLKI